MGNVKFPVKHIGGISMNIILFLAAGILLAPTSGAFAGEKVIVGVPGVEIRADGSVSAPGVEIGPGGSVRTPGVVIDSGKISIPGVEIDSERIETPGVVIEQGSGDAGGDGEVVITSDGGQINTSVSNQNLYVNGSNNKMKGAGRVLTLTVHGNNNVIELEDEVARVVVTGNNNSIAFPNDDAEIEDTGEHNIFPKG